MTEDNLISLIKPSFEEERPVIEFDASVNRGIDWGLLDAVLQGERPLTDYQEIGVVVSSSSATSWSFYSVPGTLGLMSTKLVEKIGSAAFNLFHLLPAKLNDAEYFFLKPSKTLSCLDLAKSEVVYFRNNPTRIKAIKRYAFKKQMISDSLLFSIPDIPGLFATPFIRESVVRSGILGVQFTSLE
jgi:hypothetical protein